MKFSLGRLLLRMVNPVRIYQAVRGARDEAPDGADDIDAGAARSGNPELRLYGRILGHGHLHYGFFEDVGVSGDEISLAELREAQRAYSELVLEQLPDTGRPILDCGCGIGGFLELATERGYEAVGITPDPGQFELLESSPHQVHRTKFETLDTRRHRDAFGAIVCEESLQYLELDRAFEVAADVLAPGGRWIICDYFRRREDAHESSGHLLSDFHSAIEGHGWSIVRDRDITEHVMGTLEYVHTLATEIGRPLVDFLVEKLRTKRPVLHGLCRNELESLRRELDRKMKIVEPEQVRRDKTYRLVVLEKP